MDDNVGTCKCKGCPLRFTKDCVKSDAFLAKTFDKKEHISLETIMNKFAELAFPNWGYKAETVDIISRFLPKEKGFIGIVSINNNTIFTGEMKVTSQQAVDDVTHSVISALDKLVKGWDD